MSTSTPRPTTRRIGLLLLALLALSYALVPQSPHAHAATATTLRLHSNIYIPNDAGFTVANGVVGGLGTSSQPYIIEGWDITGGIWISGTTAYFIIRNVYVHNPYDSGVYLFSSRNGQVGNSTFTSNNGYGVLADTATNVVIDRNNVSSNMGGGIWIVRSDLVTVSTNSVLHNGLPSRASGIEIQTSTRVTVRGNQLASNDIIPLGSPHQLSSLTITPDNTVDGRPVNYYYGCSGTTINVGPPQELIFAVCSNIHVTNTDLSGTGFGIQLISVSGADLSGDTFSNNIEGILVYNSTATMIKSSNLSAYSYGIDVSLSSSITIQGNNITSGNTGLLVVSSTKVTVLQNRLAGGVRGVEVVSSNVTIANNLVAGNSQAGNQAGISIVHNLGITSITNITGNSILNNGAGIRFYCSCNIPAIVNGTISRNVIQSNREGIDFSAFSTFGRFNLNVTANDLSNNDIGVIVERFSAIAAHFYHDNFISNAVQASDQGTITSFWDNGYPSGGNYWSDFAGKDNCSGPRQDICPSPDGIADTQYPVGVNTGLFDNYPLMKPFGPADTIQPSWPTGSQVSGSSITETNVALAWTTATDDTGILTYRLYNGGNLIATVSGSVHSFQVSGLMSGTNYTFKVEAVDAWGNISNSDPTIRVKTSSTGPGTGGTNPPAYVSPWQHYWPLIIAAGVAGVALTSLTLLWRRRKLRDQARTTQEANQSTGSDANLP